MNHENIDTIFKLFQIEISMSDIYERQLIEKYQSFSFWKNKINIILDYVRFV